MTVTGECLVTSVRQDTAGIHLTDSTVPGHAVCWTSVWRAEIRLSVLRPTSSRCSAFHLRMSVMCTVSVHADSSALSAWLLHSALSAVVDTSCRWCWRALKRKTSRRARSGSRISPIACPLIRGCWSLARDAGQNQSFWRLLASHSPKHSVVKVK